MTTATQTVGELLRGWRERNQLLLAAGYAPLYSQKGLDTPELASVREAVRNVLAAHEPNPAIVVDRHWNLVDANSAVSLFLQGVSDDLRTPPINVMRLYTEVRGYQPHLESAHLETPDAGEVVVPLRFRACGAGLGRALTSAQDTPTRPLTPSS